MELIVTLAILALAGYWIYDMSRQHKKDADQKLDDWQPPKDVTDKPWPYGEKVAEGKIHVKPAEVSGSEYRVEATAPKCGCGRSESGFCVGLHKLTPEEWAVSDKNPNRATAVASVTADNKAKATAKAKGAPAKKTADKKPAAKRAPAKKKST